MKKIELKTDVYVYVDDEYFEEVNKYDWKASLCHKRYYARTFLSTANKSRKISVFLQHLIVGKAPKGMRLCFKDGNTLNCQKDNLAFLSASLVGHKCYKPAELNKFRGVSARYEARIRVKNKSLVIGFFKSEIEAAMAYNHKALELFGDQAVLNNIF